MTQGPPGGLADVSGVDFSAILSIFHEGVIVMDARGTIAYCNDTEKIRPEPKRFYPPVITNK